MNIRLIVITSNIQASARLKQALEETERFQVVPFADPVAAIDYIKRDPQTVAVVDMEIPEAPGAILIDSLLTVQPDLVVFASTSNSDRATEAVSAGAWGLLPKTYSARDVLNQIEQSPLPSASSLVETGRSSAVNPEDTPIPAVAEEPERGADGMTVSERLAAEEPPMPSVEQGGTVATLMAMPEEEMSSMFDKLTSDENELDRIDEGDAVSTDTAAHRILELASSNVDPLEESDSFDDFLAEQGMDQTTPPYVREPDFLMDTSFDEEDELQDTQPADAARMLQNFDTDWGGGEAETMPQPESQDKSQLETLETARLESDEDNDETELAPPVEEGMTDQLTEDYAALVEEYDDPQIAQMAVNLTQLSLESTAEATVLSKGNMLIAYAGALSDADIDALSDKIAAGWKDIGESNSRVRYVTLPSNGLDYLVYSRRTHEDFVLSMVFAGKTPLSDIREQGKRIGDALRSVPEVDTPLLTDGGTSAVAEDSSSRGGMVLQGAVVDESLILADHTFVWLLKDPTQELGYATAEAINAGLRVQLHEIGWRVDVLEVQEDYVYLLVGVPEEQPPYEVVQSLQSRASKIARKQDDALETDGLWADSYFILSPGRELNVQEIQQYINFYRM